MIRKLIPLQLRQWTVPEEEGSQKSDLGWLGSVCQHKLLAFLDTYSWMLNSEIQQQTACQETPASKYQYKLFFFFLNLEKVNDKRDESDAVHSCSSQWWLFSLVVESSEQSALFHFTDQLNKSVGHRVACVRTWLHFMLHSAQSHERISFCSAFPLYL